MGVTGTWPELPETVRNIIYISLKFLYTFVCNPPILYTVLHVFFVFIIGSPKSKNELNQDDKGTCTCTSMFFTRTVNRGVDTDLIG